MQLKLYFAEQKTETCCSMQINVPPHHMEFRGVFLKLVIMSMVTELLVLTALQLVTQEKVKLEEKQQKQSFTTLGRIHRKTPVPESHLNIAAVLQAASLLRKRLWHRCFSVTTPHMFNFSDARKFLMTFQSNPVKESYLRT